MITDTELRLKGIRVLAQSLGDIEAERFIALIQREPFDYTQWRQDKAAASISSRKGNWKQTIPTSISVTRLSMPWISQL